MVVREIAVNLAEQLRHLAAQVPEQLRRHREAGSVQNWNDRRRDLYKVVYTELVPEIAQEPDYDAAIGSELAARIYGAEILVEEIEDDPENYTRFFAVSGAPGKGPLTNAKTSLAFVVPHEPGSLHRALGIFAERGIDLTKLESRPMPGRPWEYRFYADVRGNPATDLGMCLAELQESGAELRVLGCYSEWPESP